jgi:hypothetical protein
MNIVVLMNGTNVTADCRLQETRIAYDSTKRITTASLTIMGRTFGRVARYDFAHYDIDRYAVDLRELYEVVILDGRDGVTKLFHGHIYTLDMEHSDAAPFEIFFRAGLNDWSAFLDRAVAWGGNFFLDFPLSDKQIIQAILGTFCPTINPSDVDTIVPVIQNFDWRTKTCRAILDELAALAMAEWRIDFNAQLHYKVASAAPAAPYTLSTSADLVTSFPVKVSGYRHDFTNPVNRSYVRGTWDYASGILIEASYSDPVSISLYGEHAAAVVDDQITTAWDAALRAKSMVLRGAYPVETGNFTTWDTDWLKCGQQVVIDEHTLSLSSAYLVRALTMVWETPELVRYEAQFGAAQRDLEVTLRQIDQRSRWHTSQQQLAKPAPGSITDADILVPPGLSAAVIGSVNANTIMGTITAGQIGSVNAGVIVGQVVADQIGSVNAPVIQGAIVAGQIGSVNAAVIQGVIVSDQLADQIIDDLAKYSTPLRPIPMLAGPPALPDPNNYPPNTFFYNRGDGHFYQINAAGTGYTLNDNPQGALMNVFNIGGMYANSIIGLIVAAQIQSITAGQITGMIQASQIQSVNASSISGTISADQIASVYATAIQGSITAGQITSVNASAITGSIVSTQIGSINAATITIGLIQDGQVGTISGGKLIVGTVNSDKLNANFIEVGGGGGKPGKINIKDAAGNIVGQFGILDSAPGVHGGWVKYMAVGGNGAADAKLVADTGGNLNIKDAALTITHGASGSQIVSGPNSYDSSYTSLFLRITTGSDRADLVSRGVVVYGGGTQVAALVRAPGGNWGTLVLQGGSYIEMQGNAGYVRADGGYRVGGSVGVANRTITVGSYTMQFIGGICVSISP